MKALDHSWKGIKDKYKLVEVIGEGTSGQVVRAQRRADK